MRIERLGNFVTDLLLLPDTPALLSAGALERSGFISIWAHGYMHCLVEDKSDAIIVFDVSQNLPMIRKGGIFELVKDRPTLEKLSGVIIVKGDVMVKRAVKGEEQPGRELYKELEKD